MWGALCITFSLCTPCACIAHWTRICYYANATLLLYRHVSHTATPRVPYIAECNAIVCTVCVYCGFMYVNVRVLLLFIANERRRRHRRHQSSSCCECDRVPLSVRNENSVQVWISFLTVLYVFTFANWKRSHWQNKNKYTQQKSIRIAKSESEDYKQSSNFESIDTAIDFSYVFIIVWVTDRIISFSFFRIFVLVSVWDKNNSARSNTI